MNYDTFARHQRKPSFKIVWLLFVLIELGFIRQVEAQQSGCPKLTPEFRVAETDKIKDGYLQLDNYDIVPDYYLYYYKREDLLWTNNADDGVISQSIGVSEFTEVHKALNPTNGVETIFINTNYFQGFQDSPEYTGQFGYSYDESTWPTFYLRYTDWTGYIDYEFENNQLGYQFIKTVMETGDPVEYGTLGTMVDSQDNQHTSEIKSLEVTFNVSANNGDLAHFHSKYSTEIVSNLYTTELFVHLATNELGSIDFPEEWSLNRSANAHKHLNETEDFCEVSKLRYRIRFQGEAGIFYLLTWYERFVPDDGGPAIYTVKHAPVLGTGHIQYTDELQIDPPTQYGTTTIETDLNGNNCACAGQVSDGAKNSSVDYSINLGQTYEGKAAGTFFINESFPTNYLSTPVTLQFENGIGGKVILQTVDGHSVIRQVRSGGDTWVDVIVLTDYAYEVRLYHPSDFTFDISSAPWTPTNSPFATYLIENPDASDVISNRLNIIKTFQGLAITNGYVWSNADQGWTLTTGNGLRKEIKSQTTDVGTGDEIEHLTIKNALDEIVYKEDRRFHFFTAPLGRALIQITVDPDGDARTTSYQYYDSVVGDGTKYGKLKSIVPDSGSWTRYEYNSSAKLVKEITAFSNAAPNAVEGLCRVFEYDYTPLDGGDTGIIDDETPRTVIEKLLGEIISRRYTIVLPGERREIVCMATNSPVTASTNLVTVTKIYTQGDERTLGKTKLTNFPDGTREVNFYTYANRTGANFGYVTNTVLRGQPDLTSEMNILSGTRTVIVTTDTGNPFSATTYDIDSGIKTGEEVQSNFDEFTRPLRTTYLDGTHVDRSYSCCGIEAVTNRDGSVMTYDYDALKRVIATHRFVDPNLAISQITTFDPEGNVLVTERMATNGNTITTSIAKYNTAGRLIASTNALNNPTFFTNYVDGIGQTISITTNADNGTRIETRFRDGSLKSVTGTAVHPIRYEYGVEGEGVNFRSYIKGNKLSVNGSDTDEWTKSYTDMAGRTYKTVYSDSTYTFSSFNNKGQLTNHVDPDHVITLLVYNTRGEQSHSILDSNRDYTIDYSGNDRISFVTNDVTTTHATNVVRSRTYVWNTGGSSSNLVASSEASVNGLTSWRTIYNNGAPVTISNTVFYDAAHGLQILTNVAPDGSYSVTTNLYGRLKSATRFDSIGNPLVQITYGYDAHGRQNSINDLRNGATTFTFDDADQVVSVTTPSPDGVQAAQSITNYYDNMGRNWKTLLSDGTSVTNKYDLTGALTNTFGSRTYPVAYTYDAQGRMKTMKTWKDFANNSGAATTTWNYDGYRGWLTNKAYDGAIAGPGYSYTAAGRLATRAWARGITTTYSYNDAGDLSGVDYSDATPDITYVYDRLGRETNVISGVTTCGFIYNDVGELISERYIGGPLDGLSVTNAYDTLLRRTAMGLGTDPSTLTQYGYDDASRLATVTNGLSTANYAYLANSPLVQTVTFKQNGTTRLTTSKSYDYLNRLTAISSTPSAAAAVSFNYAYNAANQRTAVTNADNSRWAYGYDALGQVTSGKKFWKDDGSVAGQQFEYAFDDIGNRKMTASSGDAYGANLRYASYANNNLNQLTNRVVPAYVNVIGDATNIATVTVWSSSGAYATTSRKSNYFRGELAEANATPLWLTITNLAVLNDGSNPDIITNQTGNVFLPQTPETFGYDADGNMTNDGRWAMTWDAENRLIKMESLSGAPTGSKRRLTFGYDYYGRRITKAVESWTGSDWAMSSSNAFLYDGWKTVAQLNATNSGVIQSYVWGMDLSGGLRGAGGVGGLLAMVNAGNTNFYAYDGNGNVAALANASDGTISGHYEYGPFAELIRATGPIAVANPYRFSTKRQDDESDMLYYGYRYYSASVGRWTSRDPIGESGGANISAFVYNAPLNFADFLGLEITYEHRGYGGVPYLVPETVPEAFITGPYNALPFVANIPQNISGTIASGITDTLRFIKAFLTDEPSERYKVTNPLFGLHIPGSNYPKLNAPDYPLNLLRPDPNIQQLPPEPSTTSIMLLGFGMMGQELLLSRTCVAPIAGQVSLNTIRKIPGGLPSGASIIAEGDSYYVIKYPNGVITIRFDASKAVQPTTMPASRGGVSGTPETAAYLTPSDKVYVGEGIHRLNAVAVDGATVTDTVFGAPGWLEYDFKGPIQIEGVPPGWGNPANKALPTNPNNPWQDREGYDY